MLRPTSSSAASSSSTAAAAAASSRSCCRAPAPASALRSAAASPARRSRSGHRALQVRSICVAFGVEREKTERERKKCRETSLAPSLSSLARRRGLKKRSKRPSISLSPFFFTLPRLPLFYSPTLHHTATTGRRSRLPSPGHRQLGTVHRGGAAQLVAGLERAAGQAAQGGDRWCR